MSKIFFKFKSAKDYDTVLFDGVSMSAFDLKREIMVGKKLGDGKNIDLHIFDAQTNDEYMQDHDQIPRNASIIVKKVPASDFKNAARYLVGAASGGSSSIPSSSRVVSSTSITNSTSATGPSFSGMQSSTAPLPAEPLHQLKPVLSETIKGETEEERFQALFKQADKSWQEHSQVLAASQAQKGLAYRPRPPPPSTTLPTSQPGSTLQSSVTGKATPLDPRQRLQQQQQQPQSAPTTTSTSGTGATVAQSLYGSANTQIRPPPPNYVCYRCGVGGHWLQFCPTAGNKSFDNVKVKKTTGIPKAFLQTVAKNVETIDPAQMQGVSSLMVTPEGDLVIAQVYDVDFKAQQERAVSQYLSMEQIQERARQFESDGTVAPGHFLKPELICGICQKFCHDAVSIGCCKRSFCDQCIRANFQSQTASAQTSVAAGAYQAATRCPSCNQFTSLDQINVDKPKRALVGQAMRLIMEEIRKQTVDQSTTSAISTSAAGGTTAAKGAIEGSGGAGSLNFMSGTLSSFESGKKFAINIIDTTEERSNRRKFDDRGREYIYDLANEKYISVMYFDRGISSTTAAATSTTTNDNGRQRRRDREDEVASQYSSSDTRDTTNMGGRLSRASNERRPDSRRSSRDEDRDSGRYRDRSVEDGRNSRNRHRSRSRPRGGRDDRYHRSRDERSRSPPPTHGRYNNRRNERRRSRSPPPRIRKRSRSRGEDRRRDRSPPRDSKRSDRYRP